MSGTTRDLDEVRGEFRRHWRPLLAASLGMGSALSLNTYILSIFAPYLIEEFGWTRSQWAMLGLVQMAVVLSIPICGRLTDLYGVRRVAAVGAFSFPLFLLAIAAMNGGIGLYLGIYLAQTLICSTTTATVYSRIVAAAYKAHRGLALAIAGSAPPLIGALLSWPMTDFVADHGWRTGYVVVAAICAMFAVVTFLLLGSGDGARYAQAGPATAKRSPADYRTILANPVFWIMFAALFLVNLPFSLASSQLKLVVLDQGLPDATAATMVSAFAIASIVGRLISGLALDRMPSHIVAAAGFVLPVFGLLLLASAYDSPTAVLAAISLIGLSFGAEADVIPYLVGRYFGIGIFSTVLGLLTAAMGGAMASGNVLIAVVLKNTESFNAYLVTAAATAFVGSLMFLLLGLPRFNQTPESESGPYSEPEPLPA
ncbi:MAG: MFS transporter [Novosphingobium sp.]